MLKKISFIALIVVGGLADQVRADDGSMVYPAPVQNARPTARRAYSAPPTLPWPAYANYGNPVGAQYSKAAGLRQGQMFGTFGQRPADARARGGY